MPKKFIIQLLFIFALFISPVVLAATLTLDNIGALATEGNMYTSWWYNGSSPTLSGKGIAGSTVTVTIDDVVTGTSTVDASGLWSLTTAMTNGTHNVSISSGTETYSFSLALNSDTTATTTTTTTSDSGAEVPVTGFNQLSALTVGVSMLALAAYVYHTHTASYRKKSFEHSTIDSL